MSPVAGLRLKLWLALVGAALVQVAVVAWSAGQLSAVQTHGANSIAASSAQLLVATRWMRAWESELIRAAGAALGGASVHPDAFHEPGGAHLAHLDRLRRSIDTMPLTGDERQQLARVDETRHRLSAADSAVRGFEAGGDAADTRVDAEHRWRSAAHEHLQALRAFAGLQERKLLEVQRQAGADRRATIAGLTALVTAVFLATVLGARSLVRSLGLPAAAPARLVPAGTARPTLPAPVGTGRPTGPRSRG